MHLQKSLLFEDYSHESMSLVLENVIVRSNVYQ